MKISVADTGIGIPYKDQDRMFELFKLVKEPEEIESNGVGLSLVVINQIVKQFGGQMSFESIPFAGSTFIFTFQIDS